MTYLPGVSCLLRVPGGRVSRPRNAGVLVMAVLAVACSGSASSPTTLPPPATTSGPVSTTATPTTSFATTSSANPGPTFPVCEQQLALPSLPESGQVGFVAGGALYLADPESGQVECVSGSTSAASLLWGPTGDRVVAGGQVITTEDSAALPTSALPAWSRPTGTALVWVEDGRLIKAGTDQSDRRDISFLARHDQVTYHPAGFELASIGESDDGTRGVWLSSNEGENPRLIIRAEDATLHEFTFLQRGTVAFFLADHGSHWHVHEIFLVLPDDQPGANEFDASIHYESEGPLSQLVVSAWDELWAAQDGECGSGAHVVLPEGLSLPPELNGLETSPVGWLPGERLVVATYPSGCDGPADLWVVEVGASTATMLVGGVDTAGVRAAVPDPPLALGDISIDDIA